MICNWMSPFCAWSFILSGVRMLYVACSAPVEGGALLGACTVVGVLFTAWGLGYFTHLYMLIKSGE